jgi:hypothetical protein
MTDFRAQIDADQERQDAKTRERYPRHHPTVQPRYRIELTDDPWSPRQTEALLGWDAFCSCSPSQIRHFDRNRRRAAEAWRCPKSWRRT